MQFYQRIRDLREDHDLTQTALCQLLLMHKTTYTNYEQGKHTVPLDFAVILADFYNVSLDYIAGRTNYPLGDAHPALSKDEAVILKQYATLNERNKGKLEQFLETLLSQQASQ